MTRRVPNEWFSLCTTKSPVVSNCPAFRAFIRRSAPPVALFSFFNLFRFTCSHSRSPVSSSCYLSYSVIPSLPINVLLLIPRGQTIYTVFFFYFFFSPPERSFSLLPPACNFPSLSSCSFISRRSIENETRFPSGDIS